MSDIKTSGCLIIQKPGARVGMHTSAHSDLVLFWLHKIINHSWNSLKGIWQNATAFEHVNLPVTTVSTCASRLSLYSLDVNYSAHCWKCTTCFKKVLRADIGFQHGLPLDAIALAIALLRLQICICSSSICWHKMPLGRNMNTQFKGLFIPFKIML